MRFIPVFVFLIIALCFGCSATIPVPVAVPMPDHTINYQKEVKPLLDKRCAVCHSCYNSPCQLKLDSFEGLDRGATKKAIYNAARLTTMEPTRLFTDAQSTGEWRKKEFFSVTDSTASSGLNNSLMIQLLSHKMNNPKSTGEYAPEADDLTCSKDLNELGGYLEKHPNRGMPFGFPPLKQEEFNTIAGWLLQGAHGPDPVEQERLTTPQDSDAAAIRQWEEFFNRDHAKYAVTARYLYEHLFLAHLKFGTATNEFFELVRSKTPPGTPIELIPSVRPYDDPGVAQVYYRFRKIHSTIVHKTHMVVTLDDAALQRFTELFITPEWLQKPHRLGYDPVASANPFVSFEQIPPRSRYQFLLDNATYIIMTFIHGPVCKGQIALNVINDHFWIMFLDPEHDLSVRFPGFLKQQSAKLVMPIENGSDFSLFSAITNRYRKAAEEFYRVRQDYYTSHYYDGLGYDAVWKGNRSDDAPLLTIYRHFDSASVHKGVLGNLPRTMWVLDYPLLERIYYALVAGFDIYGTAGHQLSERLYMDELRIEGESYFLNFLPPDTRKDIMQSWYKRVDYEDIGYYPSSLPAKISYGSDDPKREFIEQVVSRVINPATGISFDPVNYAGAGAIPLKLPEKYETSDDYLRAIRALIQPGNPFVAAINDHNANLAYIRIRLKSGKNLAFSFVADRWHDNVAFLIDEDGRLDPSRDTIEFIPGLIGSYPNFFFDVREEDLPDFFDLIGNFKNSSDDLKRVAKYGIYRSDDRFWETYDWFQQRLMEDEPIRGGLLDLNRYYYKAR